jgi:hypothetical protein
MQKVSGSIPLSSTNFSYYLSSGFTAVGCVVQAWRIHRRKGKFFSAPGTILFPAMGGLKLGSDSLLLLFR